MGTCCQCCPSGHQHTMSSELSNVHKGLKPPFVGVFQKVADPIVSEHFAKAGLGVVLIDQQHGLLDERTSFECLQRLEKFPACFPMVRVADNTPALISRALDAGACGIVAPMINNKEDAQRLVDQCRYAPKGKRSWGPTRALAGDITPEQANEYVKVFAMIETREAIENLDSILDLDVRAILGKANKNSKTSANQRKARANNKPIIAQGVDGAFLGPADLSISFGITKDLGLPKDPEVVAAIQKVLDGCKSRGKLGLIYCGDSQRAQTCLQQGWSGVFPATDIKWLVTAAKSAASILP